MEAARSDERSRSFSRKLSRTLVAATLVVAVAASGCELLLLGGAAGAGAGAASYYMGRLEKTVPHDVPETHDAAVAALKDLGLPILQERSDQVSSHIESEFADEGLDFGVVQVDFLQFFAQLRVLDSEKSSKNVHLSTGVKGDLGGYLLHRGGVTDGEHGSFRSLNVTFDLFKVRNGRYLYRGFFWPFENN